LNDNNISAHFTRKQILNKLSNNLTRHLQFYMHITSPVSIYTYQKIELSPIN